MFGSLSPFKEPEEGGPEAQAHPWQKKVSNTKRDELTLFVSDADAHMRLLQGWTQLSTQPVSDKGRLRLTGTTGW